MMVSALSPWKRFISLRLLIVSLTVLQAFGALWVIWVSASYKSYLNNSLVAQSRSYWTEVPDVPQAALAVMSMGGFEVEGPGAEAAWDSLFPVGGGGYLYIGDDRRRYGISMFHQLHCVNAIRKAIIVGATSGHTKHCLNYIRQALLCHADPTLDDGLIPGFKYNVTWPYCRDWNTLYELAENDWVDYNAWLADQENDF